MSSNKAEDVKYIFEIYSHNIIRVADIGVHCMVYSIIILLC